MVKIEGLQSRGVIKYNKSINLIREGMEVFMEVYGVKLGKAKCGLDLGYGSERAEYVDQDYILHKLGRPHRCVNVMYTLYPKDADV